MSDNSTDDRPCTGVNSNICVAEGCYGEACLKMKPWKDALSKLNPDDPRAPGCDAPSGWASIYFGYDGALICRCMVCGRCGHHTGNSNQGHYWAFCSVTKKSEEFHFCCPDACELEVL